MICRFCGIDSGQATDHVSSAECVKALEVEAKRLRDIVEHARKCAQQMSSVDRDGPSHVERDMTPRLRLIR
jgi:hypothetical protein